MIFEILDYEYPRKKYFVDHLPDAFAERNRFGPAIRY
jgi:hypothetical protein